jgi:hypothetical protein
MSFLEKRIIDGRDKPILSSKRMLRNDYDRRGSIKKISGGEPQGACRQD